MFGINQIYNDDCLELLKQFEDNSIDSIVTDSPYELGFMGKSWDRSGITYSVDFWRECLRVLKPGGHLLSFGGTRTYHRMACAIEDAGFEIRDQIQWLYSTGFPKSLNISKAIDKTKGVKREIISKSNRHGGGKEFAHGSSGFNTEINDITAPGTSEAQQWEGWGTALKPACECICMARKQISEKNIAENVLKWGTGGLNIDGCRIDYKGEKQPRGSAKRIFKSNQYTDRKIYGDNKISSIIGRFPSNVILDEETAEILDKQAGLRKSGFMKKGTKRQNNPDTKNIYGEFKPDEVKNDTYGDSGGASRFYYVAKASTAERNEGLEGFKFHESNYGKNMSSSDKGTISGSKNAVQNNHPTVKPIKLMRYLVRLVTPPNGIVFDPFLGSGTTVIACIKEGFNYVGIEKEPDYFRIAEKRITFYKANLKLDL